MLDLKIVCEDDKYMPVYANDTDACMDLKIKVKQENLQEKIKVIDYYMGCKSTSYYNFLDRPYIIMKPTEYLDTVSTTWLFPNETRVFETGIQICIPEDYTLLIFPRSSTGLKLNCMLSNTTGVIDSGFRDKIRLSIYNFGKTPIKFEDGQRIAQFMIIPRPKINLVQVEDNEEFRNGDRGGGFGSTDSKLGV